MRTLIVTTMLATLVVLAPAGPAPAAESPEPPDYVPGELLVRFDGGRERLVELPQGVAVGDAARALRSNPTVAYANPNYLAHASSVPNDPGLGTAPGDWRRTQWNFLPCGSLCGRSATPLPFEARGGINAIDAWDILKLRGHAGAKGAVVAVLDTGVAYMSQRPGYRKSPDFLSSQFLPGRNFVKEGTKPLDRDGHGTHVTGTIAARNGNNFSLTGLASRAKIIPVQVLDAQGLGTGRDISEGIRFAARNGAQVINMSFEFSAAVNSCAKIKSVCAAIKFAKRRAVVVSAAGNENGEPVAFPAGAPNTIGVGRITKDGCLASESRTGAGLDLVAPGGGLPLSLQCGSDDPLFSRAATITQLTFAGGNFREFGYPGGYEGTSMAAAHVSGVAAMVIASGVLGAHPRPLAVECQLKATARHDSAQLGQTYDPRLFGAGLLDAAAAVTARAPGC
ncbi:MAG: S8 family serine peptidase [Solirubrobacterales bacterium]